MMLLWNNFQMYFVLATFMINFHNEIPTYKGLLHNYIVTEALCPIGDKGK